MIKLMNALKAWGTTDFEAKLKVEIQNLAPGKLPLQQGLSQSSYVSDSDINVLVLNTTETTDEIVAKTGVYFAGVIAGSCCSDDPTPVDEQTEYCELEFTINKLTAETAVALLDS